MLNYVKLVFFIDHKMYFREIGNLESNIEWLLYYTGKIWLNEQLEKMGDYERCMSPYSCCEVAAIRMALSVEYNSKAQK